MKKNSFLEGTIIGTVSIVIIKILGMIYVIPFYAIVGVQGAALYAYAYNIYSLFLEISTAGIPSAVSKLVNEYNTLGLEEAKVRAYNLGRKLLSFIAIGVFIVLFVFAKNIATLIIGELSGGNTIEDVTFVIRCVSFALLVIPFLSISRGFFQGHKMIGISSMSQIIEQLGRIAVIIGGSFLALKVFNLSLTTGVGIAVFGAFVGGLIAIMYIYSKLRKYKTDLGLDKEFKSQDKVTNKEIYKKIASYAIPVVVISISYTIYNNVDMILILKALNNLGFSASDVEFTATAISTWGAKIGIIVGSIGVGLTSSLIPNIVEASTLNNLEEVNNKCNQALQFVLFISVPMAVGISLLSSPIWSIFYGASTLGSTILSFSIYTSVLNNLFTVTNYTLQGMNKYKIVYICTISGFIINAVLDIPFMYLFNYIGLPAYWGASFATICGMSLNVLASLYILKKKYNFNYKSTIDMVKKALLPLASMILVVVIINNVVSFNINSRLVCILYVGVVALIGAFIYLYMAHKMGIIQSILGDDYIKKLIDKLPKKQKIEKSS